MLIKLLKKWGVSVLACLLGAVLIFLALAFFQVATVRTVEQSIHNNMVEISQNGSMTLRNGIKSCQDMLALQAKILGAIDISQEEEVLVLLNDFAQDARFERLSVVSFTGKVYSSTFGVRYLDTAEEVPNLKSSAHTISQPRIDSMGAQVIDLGTPIYQNGQKMGRLVVTIDDKILGSFYSGGGLEGNASLCMFAGDGTVIGTFSGRPLPIVPGENVFAFIESQQVKLLKGTVLGYKQDVLAKKSGWLQYELGGSRICLSYEPLGINDWYMSITATDHVLVHQAQDIRKLSIWLTLGIVIVVLAVSMVIVVQRVREQERIDDMKNTYNMAIRKTNDLFYEADIDSDQLIDHSENMDKAIWKESPKNYSKALTQIANVCSPEYRQDFLDTFLPQNIRIKIKEGISSINFEYKIVPDENTVRWISATFVPVTDSKSQATKLICMENDITDEKLRQERLKRSATRDGLTGLYNRTTAQSYIEDFLQGEGADGQHALMIIDIDYFKAVNDTLGHAKGDEVIAECGNTLRRIFRRNDIAGRIGGDEFVVLLKDYGVIELVLAKAKEICDDFRQERFLEDDKAKTVTTSASIGIALYGKDGKTFMELYKRTDLALYVSKKEGRNRFTLYEEGEKVNEAEDQQDKDLASRGE